MPVRYGNGRLGSRPAGSGYPKKPDADYSESQPNRTSNNNNSDDSYDNFRFSGQRTPSQNSLDKMVKENDLLNSRLGVRKSTGGRPDALQFIKTSGVTTMAEKAKETVTLMKQQKEKKKVVEVTEEDWQSNLSDWKSKMRRKSSGSLQRAQESLEYETIASREDSVPKRKSKTFREMMEEREHRKSGSYHFYPVEDSEESVFSSQKPKSRVAESDEKLSMFGFHKVEEPQHASSAGRTFSASHIKVDGDSIANSERRATSVNDNDEVKEEIAAWALEDEDSVKTTKTTTAKTVTTAVKSNTELVSKAIPPTSSDHQKNTSDQSEQSEVRMLPIQMEQTTLSPKERGEQFRSARSMFEKAPVPEVRNIPVKLDTPPKRIEIVHEPSQYPKEYTKTEVKPTYQFRKHENKKDPSDSALTRETDRKEEIQRVPINTVEKPSKNYIEKVIKISQKPNNRKGFGFTIRGGKEYSSPIVVEKVVLAGAADVCELMPGDEIVSINGALVGNHYQASVQLVIDQAVKTGQIELCIRRSLDKGKLDLFEEEEFRMEQELELEQHQDRNKAEPPNEWSKPPAWHDESSEKAEIRRFGSETVAATKTQFDASFQKNVLFTGKEQDVNISEEVPEVPCPPEFGDPSSEQESWFDDAVQQSELPNSEKVIITEEQHQRPEDSDEPPPLPDVPPPAPNWETFPEQPTAAAVDLSFLDPNDLVPDVSDANHRDKTDELEEAGIIKAKMEQLRCRAEFLGQNYQDMEEYKKLEVELMKTLEAKHENDEWHKVEQHSLVNVSPSLPDVDQQMPLGNDKTNMEEMMRDDSLHPSSHFGSNSVEQQNARMEKEEVQKQKPMEEVDHKQREFTTVAKEEPWNEDQMRTWKSMEMLRSDSTLKEFTLLTGNQAHFQEKFEQDQEKMRHEREQRMKRAQEAENEKKKQEEKLLEKELAHQRELEEIKRKRTEERRLRQLQEEKEQKEKERREEIERRKKLQREEAERRWQEQQEEAERQKKQRQREAEQRAELARRELELRKKEKHNDEMTAQQLRQEAEKLAQQEAELKAKEAELRRLETERMRQIEEEQRRREEELRRYEEEQRRKDEEERREEEAIRQKELELKKLEEKLRQEEEKLRQQREQLHLEKSQTMFKTDQVSTSYASCDNIYKGDFEYVYQPEIMPPQRLELTSGQGESRQPKACVPDSRLTEPGRSMITERTEKFEVKPSPQVTPPATHRIIKKEPLIPPKPSIKSELASWSRKEILDMNRKPAGRHGYDASYQASPLQANRRQELQSNRKSWSPDVSSYDQQSKQQNGIYSQDKGGSMSREDVMSVNRRSFSRREFPTPERETTPHSKSPSPPHPVMTKRTLHSLGAAPKPRLMSSEQWIRDEPKTSSRRSEIIRSSIGSISDHWLVEEAERRRVAEQTGQERLSYPNSWCKM